MGCIVRSKQGVIIITREFSAIKRCQQVTDQTFIWDKKWSVSVDKTQVNRTSVGPVGKIGLSEIGIVNSLGIPTEAVRSSVALFNESQILCVPLISFGKGLRVQLVGGSTAFLNFLLTY